ncbi:MAG: bis(5'-nucleosyl)-tetraphosphatase (symmetrical) YqeK [Clostridia bacterium]|nr:bis(5'-nucleosyl)-tetraphosphatase (symmetrical) YqeK [Clostridia bacterium]
MQTIDEITQYLKRNLSKERFNHTIGVAETAQSLATMWGEDSSLAFLAGLVHDCAKEVPVQDAVMKLSASGYVLDEVEKSSPALIHAPLGALLAKEIFGINDQIVLDAIRYHTTGRTNMSLLEKIIYVADFIEPNRRYRESKIIRDLAFTDLDKAVLAEADMVIKFTIDKGRLIHPDTVIARNYYLKLTKEGKRNET